MLIESNSGMESLHITSQAQLIREFMTIMSIAHEVVAEDPSKLSDPSEDDVDG